MKGTNPRGAVKTEVAANRKESVISTANLKMCHLGVGELTEGALKSVAPFRGQLGRQHCSPRNQS